MKEQESTVEKWFAKTGGGGLILPSGWFGRPYDNLHQLTRCEERAGCLVVELDNRLLLTFEEPTLVENRGSELAIEGFSSCVFDWKEYGTDRPHQNRFDGGEVKVVAPPGAV